MTEKRKPTHDSIHRVACALFKIHKTFLFHSMAEKKKMQFLEPVDAADAFDNIAP